MTFLSKLFSSDTTDTREYLTEDEITDLVMEIVEDELQHQDSELTIQVITKIICGKLSQFKKSNHLERIRNRTLENQTAIRDLTNRVEALQSQLENLNVNNDGDQ